MDELRNHLTAAIEDKIPTMFVIVPQIAESELAQITAAASKVHYKELSVGYKFVTHYAKCYEVLK